MIEWSDRLRCSKGMAGKENKIRKRVEKRSIMSLTAYCVALATNSDNLFDIYNMGELLFRYYRDSDVRIHIVGLAENREAACELAGEIVTECLEKTGSCDVKTFFECS